MSYLLDTSIVIALINGKAPSQRARYEVEVGRRQRFYLSAIVHFELLYGISKSTRREANRQRLNDLMGPELTLLPFDEVDATAAGEIRARLERAKQPIGPYDTLIAGQALARKLTLVTANTREFARVEGLSWQDWTL